MLERAVHKQLTDHPETNDLLSKTQFGCRKDRSTELATILLSDNIRKAVDEGHLVGVLYVDLSKAFDTLSHSALLEKLKSFGITGDSHNWFTDYLFNRKQFCVVENYGLKLFEHNLWGPPRVDTKTKSTDHRSISYENKWKKANFNRK